MEIQPYLFLDGRCDEAIAFYTKAIGAEVQMLMRFKETPDSAKNNMMPPGSEDKVMHGQLKIGESVILVSDGDCRNKTKFDGFALSLTVDSEAEADRYFNALADGAQVLLPLTKTFFSPRFGMLKDRFGVMWMVYVKPAGAP